MLTCVLLISTRGWSPSGTMSWQNQGNGCLSGSLPCPILSYVELHRWDALCHSCRNIHHWRLTQLEYIQHAPLPGVETCGGFRNIIRWNAYGWKKENSTWLTLCCLLQGTLLLCPHWGICLPLSILSCSPVLLWDLSISLGICLISGALQTIFWLLSFQLRGFPFCNSRGEESHESRVCYQLPLLQAPSCRADHCWCSLFELYYMFCLPQSQFLQKPEMHCVPPGHGWVKNRFHPSRRAGIHILSIEEISACCYVLNKFNEFCHGGDLVVWDVIFFIHTMPGCHQCSIQPLTLEPEVLELKMHRSLCQPQPNLWHLAAHNDWHWL